MRHLWILSALCSVFVMIGCGDGEDANVDVDTDDPTFYASQVKTQVNELVSSVGKSTSKAAEQGSILLEELEVYEKQPVGDHKETYAKLLEKCKELVAAGNAGNSSEVSSILKEMKSLADSLPGGE